MGFLTPDAKAQPSALKTASMVEQDPRISVIFVNLEEEWLPGNKITRSGLPQFLSLPSFSFPQLPIHEWRWWLGVAKDNPLLLVMIVALVFVTVDQLKREYNQCQQSEQMWSCLFSADTLSYSKLKRLAQRDNIISKDKSY
jgi:hypothetical protein